MRVEHSSAIVTGGASGLGFGTVVNLRERGVHVVVVDLPSPDAAAAAASVGADFIPADVTDSDAFQGAVAAALRHAPLRVLVNCAGIGPAGRVIGRNGALPLDRFERIIRVNLIGTFNATRLAAAAMVDNDPIDGDRGVIVMTASVAAFDGQIGQAAYSASKGGIVGMVLPVARDLADRSIRVMCIAPGTFSTPLLATLPQDTRDSLARQVPHPSRLGEPSEFAALVGHIIDNGMLNGEVIRLDGAIRMGPR